VDEATRQALPAAIALARATLAGATGNAATTASSARRALTLLPEHDLFGRAGALALLGVAALQQGDLEGAGVAFLDGMALMRALGNLAFELSGVPPLAGIRVAQPGRPRSSTITSGCPLAACATAARPSSTTCTVWPWAPSTVLSIRPICGSSSTTRIRAMAGSTPMLRPLEAAVRARARRAS
jgi:hypothetical protein